MPSEESLIQDLREIETELREAREYRKANSIDLYIRMSTHCKVKKSKIKEKIEELKKDISRYEIYKKRYMAINILKDLLKGE